MNDSPITPPPVSDGALYVAKELLRLFPTITHGISYPQDILEEHTAKRQYAAYKIATVIQGAMASFIRKEMESKYEQR